MGGGAAWSGQTWKCPVYTGARGTKSQGCVDLLRKYSKVTGYYKKVPVFWNGLVGGAQECSVGELRQAQYSKSTQEKYKRQWAQWDWPANV